MTLFGYQLNVIMIEKNLSQSKLACMIEVSQQTVSRWIHGIREPDFYTLLRLCFILKVEPNELLGYNDIIKSVSINKERG